MPEERFLTVQLHELVNYLGQRGVATILIAAHQGLVGNQVNATVHASYRADSVLPLRIRGQRRSATGDFGDEEAGQLHERTIREFRLDGGRISGRRIDRISRRPDRCAHLRRTRPAPGRREARVGESERVSESDAGTRDRRLLVLVPTTATHRSLKR